MKKVESAIAREGGLIWVDPIGLSEFQGNLKDLSNENYEKLKSIILKHKFSFVVHAWAREGKLFILDGHQRVRVLLRLSSEGYEIPKIPVVLVQADSFKQAKEKLLAGTSQFGNLTQDGLYEFLNESQVTLEELDHFAFPEIDLAEFKMSFWEDAQDQPELKEDVAEVDRRPTTKDAYQNAVIKPITLYFEGEVYDQVILRLDGLVERYKVSDYSECLMRLMDAADTVRKETD